MTALVVATAALIIAYTIVAASSSIKRELRAIAEEQAEERRIERQHAANVSARWKG